MKSFMFVARKVFAWGVLLFLFTLLWLAALGERLEELLVLAWAITLIIVVSRSASHVRRVRLISTQVDAETLASRHQRQIELPFAADEAFEMVDAAIRELPHAETTESARDSLQVHAMVRRIDPYMASRRGRKEALGPAGARRNQVRATVTPGDRTSTLRLICEPEGGAWVDWFMVDDGTNLENAEAITRAMTRRSAEKRRTEEASVRETATEKELTVAKLSLLHAQVEPHFLYNTLASAQLLTRTDPGRADQMLGNLIVYLRHSLPRTERTLSTLGEELERARAYLEILRIRMGERLRLEIQVPTALERIALPPMMLQTLVENAIKHGLEPETAGGTVWILAREIAGKVAITVADDGRGFSEDGGGTGIGLRNVRERLKLAYGEAASFSIVSNFPKGVAATITVPDA